MKFSVKNIRNYMIILLVILTCGSQYFWNYHSSQTLFALIVLMVFYFFDNRIIKLRNVKISLLIVSIIFFVSIFHFEISAAKGILLVIAKLCVVLVLSSNMTKEEFAEKYVKLMGIELAISLVCFIICSLGMEQALPGYYEQVLDYTYKGNSGYNIIYLTPYYTVGWLSTNGFFERNAGCFSEPGIHAIMLNIALLFLVSVMQKKKLNKRKKIILVFYFIIGILSTKSTGGFLAMLIVIIYAMAKERLTTKNLKRDILITIFLCISSAIIIQYGSILDKLISRSGSFITRSNDTLGGFKMAIEHFWVGYGFFTNLSSELESYNIFNLSNGFSELLIRFGFPLSIILVILLLIGIKKYFEVDGIAYVSLCILFILFLNVEPIFWNLIILIFLFYWKKIKV